MNKRALLREREGNHEEAAELLGHAVALKDTALGREPARVGDRLTQMARVTQRRYEEAMSSTGASSGSKRKLNNCWRTTGGSKTR